MSEGDMFGGISMLDNNFISIRSLKTTEDTYFYIWPKHCLLDVCKRMSSLLNILPIGVTNAEDQVIGLIF